MGRFSLTGGRAMLPCSVFFPVALYSRDAEGRAEKEPGVRIMRGLEEKCNGIISS